MAAETSSVREKQPGGLMTLLSSAACEWFLMFLLYVDAALSYLLKKFAEYCELETPCLLCSRLDYGFGVKKPGFYWSLLCSSHREEISSLASCSIHGKFADIQSMCEECLTVTPNKSNSESDRVPVGKSCQDNDGSDVMLDKQIQCSSDMRTCSCCKKTWRAKSSAERLPHANPIVLGAKVKPPLPRAPFVTRFSRKESLKRLRDKLIEPTTLQSTGISCTLSHIGYTNLKISSDSESEIPFSEDDDGGNGNSSKSEHNIRCNRRRLHESPADSEDSEKPKHQGLEGKASTLVQPNLLDSSKPKNVDSLTSDVRAHEQEESLHLDLAEQLFFMYDGLQVQLPDDTDGYFGALVETSKSGDSLFNMPAISVLSELLSLCNVLPFSSDLEIPNQINDGGTSENGDTSGADHTEAAEGTSSDNDHLSETNNVQQIDASTPTDDNLKLSDRNGSEPIRTSNSTKIQEQISNSEVDVLSKGTSNKAHKNHDESIMDEDPTSQVLPVLASKIEEDGPQLSISELGSLSKETSQKVPNEHDEPRTNEDSSSQVHPVSASLQKNDSMHKFPDEITLSNVEGEDMVEQLKRHIENDRKAMSSLYKELEEERNAAAIATNEAMSMIRRLQEEKATLHMEALQYLRMMEEQAEYMEAVERANDLLAERDRELQDLEYELEFYRKNYPDKSKVDKVQENSSLDNRVAIHSEMSPGVFSNSNKLSRPNGNCKPVNSSVSYLQDARIYPQNV